MRTRPRAEPTRMVTSKPAEHEANQAERLCDDQCVTLFSMFSCAAVCVQVSGSFIILKQKYIIVNQNNMQKYSTINCIIYACFVMLVYTTLMYHRLLYAKYTFIPSNGMV